MSVDQIAEPLPRVVILPAVATDTVEGLLLAVAGGNQEAFIALQGRMVDLIRLNVRRVLRDATRSEVVTQETFAEVLTDAIHFDPDRDSALTWLLTLAHQHAMDGLRSVGADVDGHRRDQPSSSSSSNSRIVS